MEKLLLGCVILFLALFSAYCQEIEQIEVLSNEEYAIYSILLENSFRPCYSNLPKNLSPACPGPEGMPYDTFVITDHTEAVPEYYRIDNFAKYFEKETGVKLEESLIRQFVDLNKKSVRIEKKFKENLSVSLISDKEREDINQRALNNESWEEISKRYFPNSYDTTLSRIAFNQTKNMALVHITISCGPLEATGEYVLLKRENDNWTISVRCLAWVS